MKPVWLEVARGPNSEATFDVTVYWRPRPVRRSWLRMIISQETLEKGLNAELPAPTYFVRLADGVDPASTSTALESAFLKNGLESVDLIKEMRDAMATQLVFQQLLLGFLT